MLNNISTIYFTLYHACRLQLDKQVVRPKIANGKLPLQFSCGHAFLPFGISGGFFKQRVEVMLNHVGCTTATIGDVRIGEFKRFGVALLPGYVLINPPRL